MQKWIKKYWPVLLLLLAVGYVIYLRRKANNTIGTPANTEPVNWGANPDQPVNGIAPGEPVGTVPGNPNTGGSYLPDSGEVYTVVAALDAEIFRVELLLGCPVKDIDPIGTAGCKSRNLNGNGCASGQFYSKPTS